MKARDGVDLVLLAALWGGSFLFTRLSAPVFGPVPLSALRVAGAALALLPLLAWRGQGSALRQHWKAIALVGLTNSALPFLCFGYAALALNAGVSAIFNATSPLWGALIAALWLKDKLTPPRIVGLALGFAGVLWLAGKKASFVPGEHGVSTAAACVACLAATVLYGFSAPYAKRYLQGVPPMAVAAGSQLAAAVALAVPAALLWPDRPLGIGDWASATVLALACTGLAYVMYFRLIANVGPTNAIAVTFLVPAFAVLWGAVFLGEPVTMEMVGACGVILAGTALATGLVNPTVKRYRPGS